MIFGIRMSDPHLDKTIIHLAVQLLEKLPSDFSK